MKSAEQVFTYIKRNLSNLFLATVLHRMREEDRLVDYLKGWQEEIREDQRKKCAEAFIDTISVYSTAQTQLGFYCMGGNVEKAKEAILNTGKEKI